MRERVIANLLDYYIGEEEFALDIQWAGEEFYNQANDSGSVNISEEANALFNEWLVFDYVMSNGKRPIEDYYDRNPQSLSANDLQIYKDLQNNEYAMFEVLKVEEGRGLAIKSLQSGKEYYVRERKATYQIENGNIFPGRVGKVGDHWELVGADLFFFDVQIDRKLRDRFLNEKEKLTPKIIYDIFLSEERIKKDNNAMNFNEKLSFAEIERGLDEKLEELGIKKHVSADLIKKWISDLDWKENENIVSTIISMLIGLISAEHDIEELDDLAYFIINLYNATPQKYLGNKSPNEARKNKKGGKSSVRMEETDIGGGAWMKYMHEASECMNNRKNEEAAECYDKCFESLLEEKTTNPEIYRIYANLAIVSFALGDEKKGEEMLKIALKLNPNYDFARTAFENYENGEYENLIIRGRLKKIEKNIKKYGKAFLRKIREEKITKDPAVKYYNFIKKFNINFATKELTVSDITIIGPNGVEKIIKGKKVKIGRNDPCSCGAKKPDGTPIKYKKCHGV